MIVSSYEIRRYLRYLAGRVWHEQNEALERKLVLHEVTLTETLLLRIARKFQRYGLRTTLYNGQEESQTGADWEWYIDLGYCRVGYRVQAKLLYNRDDPPGPGRYGGLKTKTADNGQSQADKLIEDAQKERMIPIYVFYNHPRVKDAHIFEKFHGFSACSWGCAVADAQFVKRTNSNKLERLHCGMYPWHLCFDHWMWTYRYEKRLRPEPRWLGIMKESDLIRDDDSEREATSPERPDREGEHPPGDKNPMDIYLQEHGLAGVAYFRMNGEIGD